MRDHNDSPKVTFQSFLTILRRRISLVILCAVVLPASALAFSLMQDKEYTAAASLLFRDPGLDQKLFGSGVLEPNNDPDREAATNVKLVSLDVVAERTATRLQGPMTASDVSSQVRVEDDGESDVVSIEATDRSPARAAALANAFAEEYIRFRQEADRSKVREAQELVQRQLEAVDEGRLSGGQSRSLRERAEQLAILASLQTGNAELVQRATIPATPSAPKTRRNVALGLVLGLLLGVGAALAFERLDRRLRDAEEIEETVERPVLAVVPQSRALARSGPGREDDLPPGEEEAFRMLRTNLRYFNLDRPIRSVLITSATPGEGKSTVAFNLAAAAASAGERVLLIEADLRHPSLAMSNPRVQAGPGLSSVIAGDVTLADAVQVVAVPQRAGRARGRTIEIAVAGPLPPNPGDLIESDRMRAIISEAERDYDLIVIDTPPTSVVSDAIPLMREVSGVIVVARAGVSSRESLAYLRRQLENLSAPTLGVVVNGDRTRSSHYGAGYGYSYGLRSPPIDGDVSSGPAPVSTAPRSRGPSA